MGRLCALNTATLSSGAKASTKDLESHLEVIQGHAFWDYWKADQIAHVGVSPNINLKLISREIIFEIFQPMWSRYLDVADRQTDKRTDDGRTVA